MLPWIRSDKRNYKKVAMKAVSFFMVAFFVFSFASVAGAQGDTFGINRVGSFLPLGGEDIRIIAAKIIRIGLSLLGLVAVSLMLYAGFTWMTSGGNEEKISAAKKIMINATIGLAIILASFAIVQFVLKSLQNAVGIQDNEAGGGRAALNFDSYLGSGGLGRIVKDHYPLRNQTNVKRNTRLAVTFREAIDPGSIIVDSNQNQTFGDCINTNDPGFNWGPQFCDQLNTSSVKIAITSTSSVPVAAAALTLLEGDQRDAFTFTFRPLSSLGSNNAEVDYTVELTNKILKKDAKTSAFGGDRHGFYRWTFRTDTLEDFDPPHVVSVYPEKGSNQPRNSIVQINFNEPMDPLVVQGASGQNSPFSHIIFQSGSVQGEWRISNGYKTVEFLSNIPCGQNSCGDTMYCLPVICLEGDNQCANDYSVLLRTALTLNPNSFESVALSGVADMAGNALDNGPENIPDGQVANPHRPGFVQNEPKIIHEAEKAPDNYFWDFRISSGVDRTAPILEKVTPNLDAQGVSQNAPLQLFFSKRLYTFSLSGIDLEEYPRPADLAQNNPVFRNLGDIWFRPDAVLTPEGDKSIVTLDHREFGPQGTNFYYFPLIPSSIKSVTQNCFHPGRGPFAEAQPQGEFSPLCQYVTDQNGEVVRQDGCVPIPKNFNSDEDTGCVQYSNPGLGSVFGSTSTCMQMMKGNQISPIQPQ